jgi:hypothetical protein
MAEREARAARLRQRMDVLEEEFIRRQAEFERAEPPKSDFFLLEDLFKEFGDFFPASARAHIVNAQRESLSALRDLLNYWIDRSGGTTGGHRPPPEHPTIM